MIIFFWTKMSLTVSSAAMFMCIVYILYNNKKYNRFNVHSVSLRFPRKQIVLFNFYYILFYIGTVLFLYSFLRISGYKRTQNQALLSMVSIAIIYISSVSTLHTERLQHICVTKTLRITRTQQLTVYVNSKMLFMSGTNK